MGRPHFTVVTVVLNDLRGLKKTREALESQTYSNWSHVVIDGKSSDGTLKYLKTLDQENLIFISEQDSGIYDAMNKGWKLAHSESYILFLNARDTFASEKSLSEAAKALRHAGNPEWGCTTHEEISQDGKYWVCKLVSPPSIANQLYAFGYRSHQGVVMKAKLIERLGGFNESYKIAADWELISKAIIEVEPTVWNHSLGRFELGGISSRNLLEAHMELRDLRKIYLKKKFIYKILDDFWCSVYLRQFSFRNYLSFLTGSKKRAFKSRGKNYSRLHLNIYIIRLINKSLGLLNLSISYNKPARKKVSYRVSFVQRINLLKRVIRRRISLREKLIRYLHKLLKIQDYNSNF